MLTIKIKNEYSHGPIWIYDEDGISIMNFPLITCDERLMELNEAAITLYNSYYTFNATTACDFSYEKERENRDKMLALISAIIERLHEICDGSYTIEDYETEALKAL